MLSKTGFTHSDLLCCQRDIHRSVNGVFKGDETHWTNQMIDPAALLLPRIPRSRPSSARALVHLMRFLRIGLSVMHLLRCDMPTGSGINAILYDITHSTFTLAYAANPLSGESGRQFCDWRAGGRLRPNGP